MPALLPLRDLSKQWLVAFIAAMVYRVRPGARAVARIGAICALVSSVSVSSAWDGAVSGTIGLIEVTGGNNQAFRVFLNGVGAHCAGGATWGFLNDTDSNYKTYVATLLLARSMNKPVNLYMTNEGGFCHIGHMMLHP